MKNILFYRNLLSQVSQNPITIAQQGFNPVTRLRQVFLRQDHKTFVQQGFNPVTRLLSLRVTRRVTHCLCLVLCRLCLVLFHYVTQLEPFLCDGFTTCDTCDTNFPNNKGKVLDFRQIQIKVPGERGLKWVTEEELIHG
jgi:hypothetical protein